MIPDRNRHPRSGHVFVALVVSIALWAFMQYWTLAYLRRISGGLEPFDLRPFGYDLAEARALLYALSELGRDYYRNIQLQLDAAYPFTYALSRVLLLLWLTIPGRLMAAPPPLLRLGLAMLPIITAICDYRENEAIAAMLAPGATIDAELVARASFWTEAKWLGTLVTDAVCIVMLVVVFHRWWQRRYGKA